MERRRGDLEAVVGGQAERRTPVHDRRAHRLVSVSHRLGKTGRARAEDKHGIGLRPVGAHVQPLARMVDDRGEQIGSIEIDEMQRCVMRREQLPSRLVVDHVRGTSEVERIRELTLLPCRAHGDE